MRRKDGRMSRGRERPLKLYMYRQQMTRRVAQKADLD